jgi:hypothetical protein
MLHINLCAGGRWESSAAPRCLGEKLPSRSRRTYSSTHEKVKREPLANKVSSLAEFRRTLTQLQRADSKRNLADR